MDSTTESRLNEVQSVLGIFQHLETFLAFLFFIAPGFISLRAYETRRGGEPRKVNEALVDIVVYSFATDLIWIPVFQHLSLAPDAASRTAMLVIAAVGFIVTAIFIGRGWYSLQAKLARSGAVVDPVVKPWDKFFGGVGLHKQVGIVLTLADGRKIGGLYAPGFASSYPAEEQLHVGETWTIDQETGAFLKRVDGSLGFIIDKKDVLTVEFFEWEIIQNTFKEASNE